jgi:hypothetical protein
MKRVRVKLKWMHAVENSLSKAKKNICGTGSTPGIAIGADDRNHAGAHRGFLWQLIADLRCPIGTGRLALGSGPAFVFGGSAFP